MYASSIQKQGMEVLQEVPLPPSGMQARSYLSEGVVGGMAVKACRVKRGRLKIGCFLGILGREEEWGYLCTFTCSSYGLS